MFFRKKSKKDKTKNTEEAKEVIDTEKIMVLIEEYKNKIKSDEDREYVKNLNELGKLYFQLEDYDNAIKYYELSTEKNQSLGQAYTDLMKLYNIKIKIASKDKNSQQVQAYLKKLDDLTQLSKDTIRGRI